VAGKDSKAAAAAAAAAAARGATKNKKDAPVPPPGAAGSIPKIIIKQGGQALAPVERRSVPLVPLTPMQELATNELRKGLWAVVEQWLVARATLPGDGQDKFKSEIKRLCQILVFDEYKQTQHLDQQCFDAQLGADFDRGTMRRDTTYTKFGFRVHVNNAKPPPHMMFEASTYIFSADSVMGNTQRGVKDLRWKTEVDLVGVFSMCFDTQSMDVDEDIEADKLQQLKMTLNTELTVSELGVLLIIAGMCCRGVAAWVDVQDLCFWSHNFTLPELQQI